MKRIFCVLLTMCVVCMSVAVAENTQITTDNGSGTTIVTYNVPEPVTEYIVTIPSNITFGESTSTTMEVSIDESSTLATDNTLKVVLEKSENGFTLKNADSTIAYEVKKDSAQLSAGSEVLSWTEGEEIPGAVTLEMNITGSTDDMPAGDYTDTLTFKTSVSDTGATHEGFEEEDWSGVWD